MEVRYFTLMRVLALDSTTRGGSIAVTDDDRVLVEWPGDASRSHAERLPTELSDAVARAGLTFDTIDVFAVAAGPGSFTGLRIGISAMQGLAMVTHRAMVAVSALEALAHAAGDDRPAGVIVGAWMNAHRDEVFAARYRIVGPTRCGPNRLIPLGMPQVNRPELVLAAWRTDGGMPVVIGGDGAILYRSSLDGVSETMAPPPLASTIARLARSHASVHPSAVQALYVRRPDVELAREQGTPR